MKQKEKATIKLGNKMYTRKAVRRYERAFIAIGTVAALIGLFFASISIGFLIFTLLITAFTFFIAYAYHTAIKADIKNLEANLAASAPAKKSADRFETFYVAGTSMRQDAIKSLPHVDNELYRSSSVKKYASEGFFWDDKVYQYDFKYYTLLLNVEHEPDNPYDSNAMKVCINDIHVGYIRKEDLDRFDEVANLGAKGVAIDILGGKYKYATMDDDTGEEVIASGEENFFIKLNFRI